MNDLPAASCPYKGLQPYTEEDREFFFGREQDGEVIASNLYASSLTILYGASGVGKSSVLLAAVVPTLRKEPRSAVVVFRNWQNATFARELKREVLNALSRFPDRKAIVDPALPLDEFLVQCLAGLRVSLFFLLDQFEEYFLYHPVDPGQDGFEAAFARAVNRKDVGANFLIALREDGLSQLDRFQGRIPNLLTNRLRLDHLRPADAENAISKPLDEYNRRLPEGASRVDLGPGLASRVIEQVSSGRVLIGGEGQGQLHARPGGLADDPGIETPFLQMVMTRLWGEAMAPASHPPVEAVTIGVTLLNDLGGAEQIVRTHLDKVMDSLDPEDRDTAARLFRYLVTPAGSKIAHTAEDLACYANEPPDRAEAVLDRLCSPEVRILRRIAAIPERGQAARYEVFHDVLAAAVLDWGRRRLDALALKDQLEEQTREARMVAERIAAEAERRRTDEAEAAARRQKTLSRRFQALAAVCGLFALFAGLLAWVAYKTSDVARHNAKEATDYAEKAKYQTRIAIQNAGEAKANAKKAEDQTRIATSRQLAYQSVSERDKRLDRSLLLAAKALQTADTFEARNSLFQALQERPEVSSFLHIDKGRVWSVAFSPDGRTIAAGYVNGGVGGVVLFDATDSKRLAEPLPVNEGGVFGVAFSPDGKTIAAGYAGLTIGGVVLFDAATRKRLAEPLPVNEGGIYSVAFSPDGRTIAAGYARFGDGRRGGVVLFDATGKRLAEPLPATEGGVISVAFSPDGHTIAAVNAAGAGADGMVLLDVGLVIRKHLVEKLLGVSNRIVYRVAFSPDGHTIAVGYNNGSGGGGGEVVLWDAATRKQLVEMPLASKGVINSVAFSHDSKTIAAGFYNGKGGVVSGVELWDVATRKPVGEAPLGLEKGSVSSVAFSPDGRTIATGYGVGGAGGVVLWDSATRKRLVDLALDMERSSVTSVAFSPDGKTIAAGFEGNKTGGGALGGVKLWDAATGMPVGEAPIALKEAGLAYVSGVAFSPDGKTIAVGYFANKIGGGILGGVEPNKIGGGVLGGVELLDSATRKPLFDAPLEVKTLLSSVEFSPDGRTIAAGCQDGIMLWDVATRKRFVDSPLAMGRGRIDDVAFSPDGRTVVGCGHNAGNGVYLWNVDLQSWQDLARRIANRDFTRDEWLQYFPDEPNRP